MGPFPVKKKSGQDIEDGELYKYITISVPVHLNSLTTSYVVAHMLVISFLIAFFMLKNRVLTAAYPKKCRGV